MGSRSQGSFLDYSFHSLQLQVGTLQRLCQRIQLVSGDWSVRVKAASDLFSLMYKVFIKLIRKRLRGNM